MLHENIMSLNQEINHTISTGDNSKRPIKPVWLASSFTLQTDTQESSFMTGQA